MGLWWAIGDAVLGVRADGQGVKGIGDGVEVGVVEIGVGVRCHGDRGVAHRFLKKSQIGPGGASQ
ncbi:hypothetical protein ABQE69_08890 [Mycolicibacillus trivialis]